MKPPVVFDAGSYLVPFGFALLLSGLILGWQFGWLIGGIYAIVFYYMLVFVNGIDRGIKESRKRR